MSETPVEEPKMKQFTVMADAVMLTTGKDAKGAPIVSRVMHGTTINAVPDDPRILDLLAIKAVAPASSTAAKRGAHVTVKMVAKGMLAEGEELDVIHGAEPLDASPLVTAAPAGSIPLVSAAAAE